MHENFRKKDNKPLIWAHRGASGYLPENTLEAFQLAAEMDADGVELDVQLTRDDKLVVIHDEQINRTSDGRGYVKDLTLSELRQFNYNRTHSDMLAHADIPTLEEVYALLKPTNLTINVELKTGVVFYPEIERKTLALTKQMGMEDRCLYSSFNHYTCKTIRELDPNCYVGFLYSDGPIDMPAYAASHGANAAHPILYNLQYPHYMENAKKHGLDVNVWTVNDTAHLEAVCRYGVNAIITNYPDRATEVVERIFPPTCS